MIKSMKFLQVAKEIVREWLKQITPVRSTYYFKCSRDRNAGIINCFEVIIHSLLVKAIKMCFNIAKIAKNQLAPSD